MWYDGKSNSFNGKVCCFDETKEQVKYFRRKGGILYIITDDDM